MSPRFAWGECPSTAADQICLSSTGAGVQLVRAALSVPDETAKPRAGRTPPAADEGVILSEEDDVSRVPAIFIRAIGQHRHWNRELKGHVPA